MTEENTEMRRSLTAIAAAVSTACMGLASATAGGEEGGTGAGASGANPSDIDVQVPDSKERVEEYWTPERMRAAKPAGKPMLSRGGAESAAEGDDGTQSE